MKKLFVILFMVLSLVVVGSAMACEGSECNGNGATVDGYYQVFAADYDWSKSVSSYGNDYGFATGYYGIGGEMNTYADAEGCTSELVYHGKYTGLKALFDWRNWVREYTPNEAFEQGFIYAKSKSKAFSWAKDSGLTSKAGAGIKADEGFVIIEGSAFGKDGDREMVQSRIVFGADFYQENAAKETGYYAGGVYAFNFSGLEFEAVTDWDTDINRNGVIHFNSECYTPDVKTIGKSEVTIDPYGSFRSIVAHTENMAYIEPIAPDMTMRYANVYGSGGVGGIIGNGDAYAGGNANFNYTGYTNGQGQANLNAVVNTQGQATTAWVSGSSSAVANGFGGNSDGITSGRD